MSDDIDRATAVRVRLNTAIMALQEAKQLIPRDLVEIKSISACGSPLFATIDFHLEEALHDATAARTLCVQAIST